MKFDGVRSMEPFTEAVAIKLRLEMTLANRPYWLIMLRSTNRGDVVLCINKGANRDREAELERMERQLSKLIG